MSWSVSLAGNPSAIIHALEEHSQGLTGQSREEYDAAKPHLIGLVEQNVTDVGLLKLTASGHATFKDGVKTYGSCYAHLESMSIRFVQPPNLVKPPTPAVAVSEPVKVTEPTTDKPATPGAG